MNEVCACFLAKTQLVAAYLNISESLHLFVYYKQPITDRSNKNGDLLSMVSSLQQASFQADSLPIFQPKCKRGQGK